MTDNIVDFNKFLKKKDEDVECLERIKELILDEDTASLSLQWKFDELKAKLRFSRRIDPGYRGWGNLYKLIEIAEVVLNGIIFPNLYCSSVMACRDPNRDGLESLLISIVRETEEGRVKVMSLSLGYDFRNDGDDSFFNGCYSESLDRAFIADPPKETFLVPSIIKQIVLNTLRMVSVNVGRGVWDVGGSMFSTYLVHDSLHYVYCGIRFPPGQLIFEDK